MERKRFFGRSMSALIVLLLLAAGATAPAARAAVHGFDIPAALESTGDPENRCEASRVYIRTGGLLTAAAGHPESGCALLTDRDRESGIELPAGSTLEILFIGAPRWLNRIRVEPSQPLGVEVLSAAGEWQPAGVFAGEDLETSDLFVRGIRLSTATGPEDPVAVRDPAHTGDPANAGEPSGASVRIAEVEALFLQVDPDRGEDPLPRGSGLYHYDWINSYPWTSDLSKCDDDATGLRNKLGWGYAGHGNSSAHEHHFVINGQGSGSNSNHVDWADLSYFSGHGSGSVYDGGYGVNLGSMRFGIAFDGTALNPSEGRHAWGNQQMEWLMATSCQSLNHGSWGYWFHCMQGMHLLCGAATNVYDKDYGGPIGRKLHDSGIFDSPKKVRDSWFDVLDFRNYSGEAVILGETSSCGNDYVWGEGPVVSDPSHNGYYHYWTRNLSGLLSRNKTVLERYMVSHPERYRPPADAVVFEKTSRQGMTVKIDRSLLRNPPRTTMPAYNVVPVTVDSSYVRRIADEICQAAGLLCGGDIGPADEGEMNLVVGEDELTAFEASGGWRYNNGKWLGWQTSPPDIPVGDSARDLAGRLIGLWIPDAPTGAVFDRVDYLEQGGVFSPEVGPETVDPDSTFLTGSRALFQRRIPGDTDYPVVGGCKLSVTFGDGGRVDRFLVNGWRELAPGGEVPVIDFSEIIDGLNQHGWAATIDPIRLPADEITITDWELGYYEPAADEPVEEVKPVFVVRGLVQAEGQTDPVPVEFYAWVEYPVLTGEIVTPADSSVVHSGTVVCFESRANGGTPPYTYEWRDEQGQSLGTGTPLCIPVDLPPMGDEEQQYVRTYELVARDADGNEGSDFVRVYLDDVVSVEPEGAVEEFAIERIRPNPFGTSTMISYRIPGTSADAGGRSVPVTLGIYDVSGRLVRTLIDRPEAPGRYVAVWDGTDERGRTVASGIYFSRLEAAGFRAVRAVSLIR